MKAQFKFSSILILCKLITINTGNLQYLLQNPSSCTIAPLNCQKIQYRMLDGTCNNLNNTIWGAYNTKYNRLLPANYGDNIFSPPISVTGNELPSARLISTKMFGTKNYSDPKVTLLAMQWGQMIAHDMGHEVHIRSKIKANSVCCLAGKLKTINTGLNCMPIMIPKNDPIYGKINNECLLFKRALTDKDIKCPETSEAAQQISVTTSHMDLSSVYGNNEAQNYQLRDGTGGRFTTVTHGDQCFPPQVPPKYVKKYCQLALSTNDTCFLLGDKRANQNVQLTLLQILFVREHNRLADELAAINPHWNDEKLFEVARSINIAQYQLVNYYEWLTLYLGNDYVLQNKLIHHTTDGKCINDYNSDVDPTILNEHSTSAFRYYHTEIAGYLELLSQQRESLGSIRISDWFTRPVILEKNDYRNFLYLSIGLTAQLSESCDTDYDPEVKHFLFRNQRKYGTDIRSIDIQRCRDTGLATYNDFRHYCGLPKAKSWEDYYDVIPKYQVDKLKTIYDSYEDVDLSVGTALENIVNNTLTGPTNLCIITEQFLRTRLGDRFFFENCEKYGLTERQLKEIRKVTAASILCRNTGMKYIQKLAFLKSDDLVPCDDIPKLDLHAWNE